MKRNLGIATPRSMATPLASVCRFAVASLNHPDSVVSRPTGPLGLHEERNRFPFLLPPFPVKDHVLFSPVETGCATHSQ
jgi:hypothetical protein